MNKDNRFWKIALPALLAMVMAGAAAGLFTGLCAQVLIRHLEKIN